ncbi:MAG: SAM-dependent methyltransferase, partial [Longicatena sp.]
MKKCAIHWKDYECIDAGNGEKLERWKNIVLRRPDPQAVWT